METSILITPDQYKSEATLPSHLKPTRASASTNFLISLSVDDNSSAVLLLHNFDPVTYNIWYPPFYFTPWTLPRVPDSYREMCEAVFVDCPSETKPDVHSSTGAERIREKFHLSRFNFVASPSFEEEIWLKFSNSKQEWTVYRFNYFYAADVIKSELLAQASESNLDFLPLDETLAETLSVGQFRGKPIVDNLLRLLSDPRRVELLKSIAV